MMQIWMTALLLFAHPTTLIDDLTITHHGKTISRISREDVAAPLPGTPLIDQQKYQLFTDKLDQQMFQAPVNATINDRGSIVPERAGYKLDRRAFQDQFHTYFFGRGSSSIEAPAIPVYPMVDSELLADIRVKRIGWYVTHFNSGNKSRAYNISLAAKAINNHVIFPNETFSFNEVVGKRTKSKGYRRAPIIVKGELSEDVGGGICQVSSTLFNAVDRAGLHIVQRYSHSRRVPYVPPGRDATVSWYGPDFRFQNKYNQPILIRAKGHGGSMTVALYSSDVINFKPRKITNPISRMPEEIKNE
ncbi:hypothetical protein EWH99_10095 [Sporolactobacillus sp. THM7-7]|nr:hypothetical protein EWH99_10095 [Sporolactobacillus sp. THM7-7]